MKTKRLLLFCLITILAVTGCSKKASQKASNKTVNQTEMGRYVENNAALPKGVKKEDTVQLTKKDDKPFLYTFKDGKKLTITGYQRKDDGSWTEDTPEWLKKLPIGKGAANYQDSVFGDAKGNQYLYYVTIENGSYKGNLLQSKDGKTYETLHPEGWDEKDPKRGYYTAPDKVNVLKDGTIAAIFYQNVVQLYNNKSLKKEKSITDAEHSNTILSVADQSLILGQCTDSDKIQGIDVYNTVNDLKKVNYPIKSTLRGSSYLDINDRKDLVLCNPDGVHLLKKGTSIWQTVIDGTLTSLSMQNMYSTGFVVDSKENYYVLFNSDSEGYSLKKYTFDKSIAAVPSKEIKLYALKDNATLRQAAAVLQKKNPDVKVDFQIAMTDEEYEKADITIKEDYIKALNTELIAGKGPDIIVLDGLPQSSLVEKGVLMDISDIVKPMVDRGELYPNIMKNYMTNGKIYSVPVRFNLQLLCGKGKDTKALSTLAALADYANNHKNTSLLGKFSYNDFMNTFTPYLSEKIFSNNGKIDHEKLLEYLKELKAISDNSGLVEKNKNGGKSDLGLWALTEHIQLAFDQCNGLLGAMLPVGLTAHLKGSYTPFENSFTPSCEIGINNSCSQKKLCKEFISLALSKDIEKNDFSNGFSTNKDALILSSTEDNSYGTVSIGTSIKAKDGSYKEVVINALNKEQITELLDACGRVTNRAACDDQMVKIFKEESKEYFMGSQSVEETADRIIKKSSTYLSE